MGSKEFLALALVILFGGSASAALALKLINYRSRRRTLSRMVWKPPAKLIRLERKDPQGAEFYLVTLLLTFGLPEDKDEDFEEVVPSPLAFRLDRRNGRYFFATGGIFALLGDVRERGLGKTWIEPEKRSFWSAVEDAVSASILQREEGMQKLEGMKEGVKCLTTGR